MKFDFIVELEKKLLNPIVQRNATELDLLLHDEFVEHGTSGRVVSSSNSCRSYNIKTVVNRHISLC